MKKISVIVPIYNTKEYLYRCLDSICKQTYQNLEIICIDDGSTDGSEKILDEVARLDNRIIAIHQINAGESHARNVGLNIATGEYITFCDCDDWLEKHMYEKMVCAMEANQTDIVACGYSMNYPDCEKIPINEWKVKEGPFSRKELFEYVYIRDRYRAVTSWLWCKLFKRELFTYKEQPIRFDENVRFGADLLVFLSVATSVRSACYVSEPLYHYFQRESSTSHTKNLEIAYEIVEVYLRMIEFCKKNHVEEEIIPWIERFAAYRASLVAEEAILQKNSLMLEKCQNIMKLYEDIYMETNQEFESRIIRYKKIKTAKV